MKTTAVFGGTFNPPHNEHIAICQAVKSELGIDRIVVLPTSVPPHKSVGESQEDRLAMTRLCFDGTGVEIDLYEQETAGVHYSVDTLRAMRAKYGDIVFVIGGDSAIDFFKWRQPEVILAENKIAVCGRFGREKELDLAVSRMRAAGGDVAVLNFVGGNVSSTMVRYAASLGVDMTKYVPARVAEYIKAKGLYQNHKGLLDAVRARVDASRYAHTLRTAMKALELNAGLGLDNEKVFLAAVLHDVGKNERVQGVPSDAVGSPVAHQFSGAVIAQRDFGIDDREILDAIACHTTGKPDMTALDKLIFVADLVEDGRDYDEAAELRSAVERDFEKGFRLVLERDYLHLQRSKGNIYHLTQKAYEFYNQKEI